MHLKQCESALVQDLLLYRRVLTTQALYTCNFVCSLSLLFVQTLFVSLESGNCLSNASVELGAREFLFADDFTLNAGSEREMQLSMDKLFSVCDNFGLTVSTKKTEVMHQPAPNRLSGTLHLCEGTEASASRQVHILIGSTLSRVVLIDDEINSRIAKASSAFGRCANNCLGSQWNQLGN